MRTMGRILGHWRTLLASLFAVSVIAGAYVLARGIESPSVAQASTETELLKAIATKDSTGDGLPDWQKALYGIPLDATTTDYFHLGMTDGEAVAKGLIVPKAIATIPATVPASSATNSGTDGLPPAPAEGTLTAAFAQSFFALYLQAKQSAGGADLTEAQMGEVANQAIATLRNGVSSAPDFKTASDLTVVGSGKDALLSFAAAAEGVLLKNTASATTSELVYLKEALINNHPEALTHIESIASAYRAGAAGLAALSVPQEIATGDVHLINALMRVGEITTDFSRVHDDPLAAILALGQYAHAVAALAEAFHELGIVYLAAGIMPASGTPGAAFVKTLESTPLPSSASHTTP